MGKSNDAGRAQHGELLFEALGQDMAQVWSPIVENYAGTNSLKVGCTLGKDAAAPLQCSITFEQRISVVAKKRTFGEGDDTSALLKISSLTPKTGRGDPSD
jgi:hypothetical protein